ncbi:hypothetical protein HAHE_03630 [Haloferula helveola]|uniref:Uncharacterized protein n=1 Tax=Haloferula helveola TaxID=490095 RepID=A0ABM7RCR4_9BACT|nr:hypothetical protein HAHE_03630 [Haloferula helveola]
METPEQIERALMERLVPRGFSDRGAASLDELIDELADETPAPGQRRTLWWGAAAAVALTAGVSWGVWPRVPESVPVVGMGGLAEVELLSESVGVVSTEADDRLLTDSDGSLLQAWNVTVVNEELFRDEQTGHEVRVIQPRDELVLIPVTAF